MSKVGPLGRQPRGIIFVISGPSGVGKGTVLRAALEQVEGIEVSVSATTRPPRANEEHGVAYYFMSDDDFSAAVEQGKFLEWAHYHRWRYGTLRSEVQRITGQGCDVALEIDVQGARQVRATCPESVLICLLPPSFDDLRVRLEKRGTETVEEIAERLEVAKEEIRSAKEFDYIVVNDEIQSAAQELCAIFRSERLRVCRANVDAILGQLT